MRGHRKRSRSQDTPGPGAHAPHDATARIPSRFKRLLGLLAVAQLMVILDITAVNVALPDMADSLGISGGGLGWIVTSYSLVFGSLLLLGGRLADFAGRRRVFMTGLGTFTVASVAAASAIGDAFLAAAAIAGSASLIALLLLPSAASFLPKLRPAPRVAIH